MDNDTLEWWNIALLMQDVSRTLPDDWDHGTEFWLDGVQCLAETIAELKGLVPIEQLGLVLGVGGVIIAHCVKQAEAADVTAALFARLQDGGARG